MLQLLFSTRDCFPCLNFVSTTLSFTLIRFSRGLPCVARLSRQGCPSSCFGFSLYRSGLSHSLHGIMSWHCHFCWVFPTPYTGIISGFYHSLHGIPPNNMRYYGPHSCLLWWRGVPDSLGVPRLVHVVLDTDPPVHVRTNL